MTRFLVAAAAVAALALSASGVAAPPQVTGRAFVVENGSTGEVLLAHDARERVPIASITKLMTVLLTLEHARPGDVVTVSPFAAGVGESSADLRAGERLTVLELLEAALIQSANDAADALAFYVGHGSEERFVAMMNAKALRLGLKDTHFVRPDGLDAAGHVSSARDVTRLAQILMHDRFVRSVVRERTATISGGRTLHTWNDLLGEFPGVFGVKTGHTTAAGWNEVVAVRGNGVTIYATILGSPTRSTRNAELEDLLAWGLSRYALVPLAPLDRVYGHVPVTFGRQAVPVVATRPLRRPVRIGRPLVEQVVLPSLLELPVRRGQIVGEVRVFDRKRLVGRTPLVAAESRDEPGLLDRSGWYAGRAVDHVGGWFS